ncbi:UDP-N-acetylmuramyl-tripeptide synthetase [Candidatus Woesebacteria bacterium]|nr:UDP-N-acetylmuramyl-tripeptide synthetase [Candidatus Woesebacteria bacterium]
MIALIKYKLKRVFHFFKTGLLDGLVAQIKTNFPEKKLVIILVTGTDGKTSTSTMTYQLLKAAGFKVGLITTVAAYIGEEHIDTGFHVTAPQPALLYKFMRRMVDAGYTHLVLEMTSHGAYQFRNWGIVPYIAGLTNITHEHFDYHITYAEYVQAKLSILKSAKHAFVNADDESYRFLKTSQLLTPRMETYSSTDVLPSEILTTMQDHLKEPYNQMNMRLAVKIAQKLGCGTAAIVQGITDYQGVPGRMELVATKPVRVIVDFAHTPQALQSVLSAVREQYPQGKLIAVFGSAGLRDTTKRPLMGKIGSELADKVILTSEDPRIEDIWTIIRQIKGGAEDTHAKIVTIVDRYEAIRAAIQQYARKGDTVIICGKGHEQSMCYGTTEYPWSDITAVDRVLAKKQTYYDT